MCLGFLGLKKKKLLNNWFFTPNPPGKVISRVGQLRNGGGASTNLRDVVALGGRRGGRVEEVVVAAVRAWVSRGVGPRGATVRQTVGLHGE